MIAGAVAFAAGPMVLASGSANASVTQQGTQGGAASATQTSTQAATPQNAAPQAASASPDDARFATFVFDVVSIKPHKDDPNARSVWMGIQDTPDGERMRNVGVTFLIANAFRTAHSKASGAPDWAAHEMYDIETKMDPDVADAFQKLSPADQKLARQHMMQALVRDYMKAKVHMETTEVSVYNLVIAKNGSKLKEPADPAAPSGGVRVSGTSGGMMWTGQGTEIGAIMGQLSYAAGRPVYDETGLTGRYDFTLKYAPDTLSARAVEANAGGAPGLDILPPLAQALEEQLGLNLVSAKGKMDVIVIDHVERPSPN